MDFEVRMLIEFYLNYTWFFIIHQILKIWTTFDKIGPSKSLTNNLFFMLQLHNVD
jgi:hypothetical protein